MRRVAIVGLLAIALAAAVAARHRFGFERSPAGAVGLVWMVSAAPFRSEIKADGILEAAENTPVTMPVGIPEAMTVSWVATEGIPVAAGDVLVRFDASDMELRLLDGEGEHLNAGNRIVKEQASARALLRNLERDAETAGLEIEAAGLFSRRDPELFSRVAVIESQIDELLATARRDHAVSLKATRSELSSTELELLGIAERTAELKIDHAKAGLAAVAIAAPHAGVWIIERDWSGNPLRVGERVWPGRALGRIPNLGRMQAEVQVLEADAGGLTVGQRASVAIAAHPERSFGARVSRVDTLAKPLVPDVPVQYFGVTLELDATDSALMKPGQRVRAAITVEERASALTVPRQAVFERGAEKVVYRLAADAFEARPVTLGPASLGRVIVESGLAAGDVVALSSPLQAPGDAAASGPASEAEGLGGLFGAAGGR